MNNPNFSDIAQNAKSYIKKHFLLAEEKGFFLERNFEPSTESEIFLIGLHVIISDQIHQFLKQSYRSKIYLTSGNDLIKVLNDKTEEEELLKEEELLNLELLIKGRGKIDKIQKILNSPSKDNIENFLSAFNVNFKNEFQKYEPCKSQPYSSFDVFNNIYDSRCYYVHDNTKKVGNKLQYQDLKEYEIAIYQFMIDVIKILKLPDY
jgi:hypothetical protein